MAIIRRAGRAVGRVQGVGCRAFVQRQARALGFTGWVRNEADGSVRLEAQGDAATFARLDAAIRAGDRWIRVDQLTWTELDPLAGDRDFTINR